MYAKLILRFERYSVQFGMLCHLYIFAVRSFLRSKPGRGPQRQVSICKNEYLYVNVFRGYAL
jgi:hypothetical protein